VKTNGTNGDSKETNGNGHIHDENDLKSKYQYFFRFILT
jgi:hypothetical protein